MPHKFNPLVGYCMNVHPATNLESVLTNLKGSAAGIRNELVGDGTMNSDASLGVGLWLSQPVVDELQDESKLDQLRQTLQELQLQPFTFNGFPQHNFHQAIVKHNVYIPTWAEESRLSYTQRLARIMTCLIGENEVGTISTLPIGWPSSNDRDVLSRAALHLHQLARYLDELYKTTGRKILVAVEPEPGCILGDSSQARKFFLRYLLDDKDADLHREYLTICHDVCHAAVMREDQKLQIQAYRDCGIRIGKVQVSSAIHVNWDTMKPEERADAFQQVSSFAEDRYLHQTTVRTGPVGSVRFVEDLQILIAETLEPSRLVGNWTIHFHVPIHVESFGRLHTTQDDIAATIEGLATAPTTPTSNGMPSKPVDYKKLVTMDDMNDQFTGHFEIETYAWSVIPQAFRRASLVEDISNEFRYLIRQLDEHLAAEMC